MPKIHRCKFCGGTDIKVGTFTEPDLGVLASMRCQDCGYTIKTSNDNERLPIAYETRYEARKILTKLWNLFNSEETETTYDRGYCDYPFGYEPKYYDTGM